MATLTQTIPALPVRDAAAAVSRDGVDDTDFGTRDLDGNLVTFFGWVEQ
jgi:hypothetical protein